MTARRCFILNTSWPDYAAANHYKALGRELAARGHRVIFLVGERRTKIEDHAANPAVYIWPSHRPTRPADFRFMRRLIGEFRPDALIASFGAVNVMMTAGWLSRVPVRVAWYCTVSGAIDEEAELSGAQLGFLRRRKGLVYRLATHIAAISEAADRDVQAVFGVPDEKTTVWRPPLADPLTRIRPGPRDGQRLVCAGRLLTIKGQDLLIRAVALLAERFPRLTVEFIGDGPERVAYERLAADLGVAARVCFTGVVDNRIVLERMASAALVIAPSRMEALGMVNVEALAVGTPVVATTIGGIGEIVRDGVDGYLVPPDDVEGLAARIERLLTDRAIWEQFSGQARQGFLERFEMNSNIGQQADWYEGLAAAPGARSKQ